MSARAGDETVVRTLDAASSVLRRLAATRPDRYPVLLDSVARGPLSRVSILGAFPRAALWLDANGRLGADGFTPRGAGFFEALENWWLDEGQVAPAATDPVFAGGWMVFLSYEMAQEVEPHLRLPAAALPFRAFALRTPCAIIHDQRSDRLFAVAEANAASLLDEIAADAKAAMAADTGVPAAPAFDTFTEEEPQRYIERVVRAREYIRAGDVYQANLSRPWRITLRDEPDISRLYERLCAKNPAPFAALAQWKGVALLSSSPERLVSVVGRDVQTRPIAGTRPRSLKPGDDASETAALVSHPKERAEHIMLIDLERNDLGRVCEAGTVHVDELMVTETYAHVHHIVSNVRGVLRPDVTPIGAIRAVFPGGTITGCPKFRCMQIIAELEGEGRGAYTGSMGYLSRTGTMDLNILIRTMTVTGRQIELRAGAGIVADSDPQRELEETRAKARGLLKTFESDPPAGGSG